MLNGTYKVLIIDDDNTLLGIECSFVEKYMKLKNFDFSITQKTESFPALFELNEHGENYDLIILDNQMPQLNGDEILHSLMPSEADFLNRIVFVTADPEPVKERFPKRMQHILSKPFSYTDFKSIADTIIGTSAIEQPQFA